MSLGTTMAGQPSITTHWRDLIRAMGPQDRLVAVANGQRANTSTRWLEGMCRPCHRHKTGRPCIRDHRLESRSSPCSTAIQD